MKLLCSHESFKGSLNAFNRFRQAVAHVIGGQWALNQINHPKGIFEQ